MSKSKRFCIHNMKPSFKDEFSSAEQLINHSMKVISDYKRARSRIPEMSPLSRRYAARKFTSVTSIRSGSGKRCTPSQPPKSTPFKAVKKSEKAPHLKPVLSPKPRLFVSRKFPSSLPLPSRIAAGGSGKLGQASKAGEPCQCQRAERPSKAAEKCEKLPSKNGSTSKPEPVKPTCSDAPAARHESSVSFQEPVAREIPSCDLPDQPKALPISDSHSLHRKRSLGCCKRPVIVVTRKHHKGKDHHLGSSTSSSSSVTIHHQDHLRHSASSPSSQLHEPHEQHRMSSPSSHHGDHSQEHHRRSSPSSHHEEHHPKSSPSAYHRSYIPYTRGKHSRSSQGSHHLDHNQHPGSSTDSHNRDHIQHHGKSSDSHHSDRIRHRESCPNSDRQDQCEKEFYKICPDSHQHDHIGHNGRFTDSRHRDQTAKQNNESCPESDNHDSFTVLPPCDNSADVDNKLAEFARKLEDLQIKDLPDIRQQIEGLNTTLKALAEKSETKKEPELPVCPNLERKSLSTCQFCQGRDLPVLDSFHAQLMEKIGPRSFSDVVMSVFLRADNIYHVNVRDMSTGSSLSCFLVTDNGITEAQQLGLFQEILTFSVIDVRNTLKPRNCALGITFELVPSDRQQGGSDSLSMGICMACKPFVARVLGLPLEKLKYLYGSLENTNNYPERSLRRFRNRIARIQASSVGTTSQGKSKQQSKVKTRTWSN